MFYETNSNCFFYIQTKIPEYSGDKIIEKYGEHVKLKFKSHNLEEYNLISEKFNDLYSLRTKSKIFFIFFNIGKFMSKFSYIIF